MTAAQLTDRQTTDTHCPYCGLQCAMTLSGTSPSDLVVSARRFPTNRGGLCQKGWTSAEMLRHPGRVVTPLVREGAELVETSWDVALDRVADGMRRAQAAGGKDAVALFGGGGLTNEKAYQLGKFARVALGTAQIDYNGRWCMSSAAAAGIRCFGLDRGLPFPVTDLSSAHAVLLLGANPAETMPPFLTHLVTAADAGGLVVADPRLTPTAALALEGGGVHLQLRPGTDGALALGMIHVAVLDGLIDRDYITTRTNGWEDLWSIACQWFPDRTERVTGVAASSMRRAVGLLARARDTERGAYVLSARGGEQHATGTDTVSTFIGLALCLGLPGNRGSGFGTVTGQGNGQGGREQGQKCDQLPGARDIENPEHRRHMAEVWGVPEPSIPHKGVSAVELVEKIHAGEIKGLLLICFNPLVSLPDQDFVREALEKLEHFTVIDFFLSETARHANVVLPGSLIEEDEGTITTVEGRVVLHQKVVEPPAGARADWRIICDLAAGLGVGDKFAYESPRDIFDELRRASRGGVADYYGITWDRIIAEQGVFWPCPTLDHPGTPRLYEGARFGHPDGKAHFQPVEWRPAVEEPDEEYPIVLTTGRVVSQYLSGSQTRRIGALDDQNPQPFCELHPRLAEKLGIAETDFVKVESRRGSVVVRAMVVKTIRPDTVFVPYHWPLTRAANRCTIRALDPISKIPEYKICAVRVSRAEPPDDEIARLAPEAGGIR